MPHYYFDIKDGHRLVDPSGLDFKDDDDAVAKANVVAIGVSLDKPAVDPERHIAVLNDSREEISRVPVYSKPSIGTTKVLVGTSGYVPVRRSKRQHDVAYRHLRLGSSISAEGRRSPLPSSVDKRPSMVLMTSTISCSASAVSGGSSA
jgi:hypothetical protein